MSSSQDNKFLRIIGASENNLKSVDVQIPHNTLTVITGVSGSGKSSLAYNVIYRESQRRFLESFSSYSRQFIGKLEKPNVEAISGLRPALAINQKASISNPRSTVGTMSGVYDYLRLLYARIGIQKCSACGIQIVNGENHCKNCNTENIKLQSKLFSFNSNYGACPECKGLGLSEQIDIHKLIANPYLTLREGALVPTTPTGYIVYSQVRVDELNKVCNEHDFSVDIPWNKLTKEQQDVVLYGSEKIKILFGKHSLESRLKWKGITALPREESYYKGMIPIMEDILRRDRNDNILRFASSYTCNSCNGTRLREEARSVLIADISICDLSDMSISKLISFLQNVSLSTRNNEIANSILVDSIQRLKYMQLLGLDYLTLSRESTTLSGGESQRIRLTSQVGGGLQGILYILDEPSIGLHPRDNKKLLSVLKSLRNNGNTVVVVEHDEEIIKSSDYLIDIGPKAGIHGGELLFQGNTTELLSNKENYPRSITAKHLSSTKSKGLKSTQRNTIGEIRISNSSKNNLKNIDVNFKLNAFNVVTGVSGAGKSTLVHDVLGNGLRKGSSSNGTIDCTIPIKRIIEIDQSPIGRTPRSNPATYTDLFDHIRDLYSKQPESIKRGFKKGRFSFNNKGGRCERCEGSGQIELGMHFLGNISTKCELCNGRRYKPETLDVEYKGKNIYEVLQLSIEEAILFFEGLPKIIRILNQLIKLDVGYLKLGQPSTTLSGGEAQRVKLASELYKNSTGHCLYILDEPSVGLHKADISYLLGALNEIIDAGNTVIVIEHDLDIISKADHIIDLGPEGGDKGGNLIVQGSPLEVSKHDKSYTGQALTDYITPEVTPNLVDYTPTTSNIIFKGITTNNLKNIDIEIPLNCTTVITGLSGSGKSSLAFDTIYSESRNRFTESLSSYARRMMSKIKKPEMEDCKGLTPAIAIRQNRVGNNTRSTIGTFTDIYNLYRLLFSRFGIDRNGNPTSFPMSMFSFNNIDAACDYCKGLGISIVADPKKYITHKDLPLISGAMDGSKPGRFFGDINGQYINTLIEVGLKNNIDFNVPFSELDSTAIDIALNGTDDIEYEISWKFKRGGREGTHKMTTTWKGFTAYLEEEYHLKKDGKRGEAYLPIVSEEVCVKCNGSRYLPKVSDVTFQGFNISQLSQLSVQQSIDFFQKTRNSKSGEELLKIESTFDQIVDKLNSIKKIGLGYLNINRATSTLSGGESQLLRLATQLDSGLSGLTYILDEPTIGLHSHDTNNLINIINQIKDNGNTVVLVEHDPEVIVKADNIIDLGPGAGKNGGRIIAKGSLEDIINNPKSITGRYLNNNNIYKKRVQKSNDIAIDIRGAKANNLKNIDVLIHNQSITSITGVSGSGKSSLVFDVISNSYNAGSPVNCSRSSFNNINSITSINQHKIGVSPLSTISTYTGIFDAIRDEFSKLPASQESGLKKSHFSFNSKEGNCTTCKGMGNIKVSMDFLSDVWVVCDDCQGNRYKDSVLKVKLNNHSIIDVLNMEVNEALDFFQHHKKIVQTLKILQDIGLGYILLGQSTSTLSGGETQRLKLASELTKSTGKNNLYIFDEPSTGLHMQDVEKLMSVFERLVYEGNTVVVVEHNLEIIKSSDWIIDLGPDGGELGGSIVYNGNVDGLVNCSQSYTGKALMGQNSDNKDCCE